MPVSYTHLGELHLEIIVDRLLREFKVEANVGKPQVAYRETFLKDVDVEGKFVRQSGGRGQYGHCKVRFYPIGTDPEHCYEFVNSVVGGAIPKEYIPAIDKGIQDAMPVSYTHLDVYKRQDEDTEMIAVYRNTNAYEPVLEKNADGKWERA